jgi:hypothetical protein
VKRRTIAILAVVAVVLFAFFVPVVYDKGNIPQNCVFCPLAVPPSYASISKAYLGSGAVYSQDYGYYFSLWGNSFTL